MKHERTRDAVALRFGGVNGKLVAIRRAARYGVLVPLWWAAAFACGEDAQEPQVAYVTLGGVPCMDGAVACGDVCVQLASSAEHCGVCGNACALGSVCDLGRCRPSGEGCSDALTLCGRDCVDLRTADDHCGACAAACPSDADCEAAACECPGLLTACGDACVDTSSDVDHCGACQQRCLDQQTCENAQCQCPPGTQACSASTLIVTDGMVAEGLPNESCVDTRNDPQHCGACDVVCAAGQLCDDGRCVCPAEQALCDDGCVDTQTSAEDCGSCGNACTEGYICSEGACVCPFGQTPCDGICIDTQTDAANCGACGAACALGEGCVTGSCQAGAPGEDGCQGLAADVRLAEVAAYQTVKVTLARDGESVAPEPAVVARRPTLFRVFVATGDDWAPRPLSGRLFLQDGETTSTHYSDILTLEGSSREDDRTSSFEFRVAPERITPQTRFAVELVECGASAAGATQAPRYPAADAAALDALETGGLRVHFVPLRSNGRLPDTSEPTLQLYEAAFLDTYPVSAVQFSLGEPLDIADPTDFSLNLDTLRALRQQEAPDPDVYYYGLLQPSATLEEFCGNGCVAGAGYIAAPPFDTAPLRAAIGLAFADVTSAFTMLHEVAHNHGRGHAPCAPGNQILDVDPNYPQPNGTTGVYGYDALGDQLLPPNLTDLMGYCEPKWLSAYTYGGILQRVFEVNQVQALVVTDAERIAAWRVLLVDAAHGARWGIPSNQRYAATGTRESAPVLDATGAIIEEVSVYRTEVGDVNAFSIEVPEPRPGWHSIRVAGAAPLEFAQGP